jgi:hypothetical protein
MHRARTEPPSSWKRARPAAPAVHAPPPAAPPPAPPPPPARWTRWLRVEVFAVIIVCAFIYVLTLDLHARLARAISDVYAQSDGELSGLRQQLESLSDCVARLQARHLVVVDDPA